MHQRTTKNKKSFFVVGTVVFFLIIYIVPVDLVKPFRSFVHSVFAPLERVTYVVSRKTASLGQFFGSIGDLKRNNQELAGRNIALTAENELLRDFRNENEKLRNELSLLPRDAYVFEHGEIIARDPHGNGNWLTINKGSSAGIAIGDPVVVSEGILIGTIARISARSAHIMLLTNAQSVINAASADTNAQGVVRGQHGLSLRFDEVLQTDVLTSGTTVLSSDISARVPRGLLIGTVQDVTLSPDGLSQQATVVPPLPLSSVRFVSIIKEERL